MNIVRLIITIVAIFLTIPRTYAINPAKECIIDYAEIIEQNKKLLDKLNSSFNSTWEQRKTWAPKGLSPDELDKMYLKVNAHPNFLKHLDYVEDFLKIGGVKFKKINKHGTSVFEIIPIEGQYDSLNNWAFELKEALGVDLQYDPSYLLAKMARGSFNRNEDRINLSFKSITELSSNNSTNRHEARHAFFDLLNENGINHPYRGQFKSPNAPLSPNIVEYSRYMSMEEIFTHARDLRENSTRILEAAKSGDEKKLAALLDQEKARAIKTKDVDLNTILSSEKSSKLIDEILLADKKPTVLNGSDDFDVKILFNDNHGKKLQVSARLNPPRVQLDLESSEYTASYFYFNQNDVEAIIKQNSKNEFNSENVLTIIDKFKTEEINRLKTIANRHIITIDSLIAEFANENPNIESIVNLMREQKRILPSGRDRSTSLNIKQQ